MQYIPFAILIEVGVWRSLVAHLHGVQGVAGSSPVTPTIGSFLVIPEHLSELPAPQYQYSNQPCLSCRRDLRCHFLYLPERLKISRQFRSWNGHAGNKVCETKYQCGGGWLWEHQSGLFREYLQKLFRCHKSGCM